MLKIGEFSKLTKTTIKALRYYDKIGLLKPAFVDGENMYRYYTEEQIGIVQQIQAYQSIGLSCNDILGIFNNTLNRECLLDSRKLELELLKTEIDRQIEQIYSLVNKNGSQNYSPCIKEISQYKVCYSRSFISDITQIGNFMSLTVKELKRTNPDVDFPSPDYCCVIYPDKSYRKSSIYVEYVQAVNRIGVDTEAIKFKMLEPITAVCVTHYGRYENLCEAYLSAIKYAKENQYEICANARERYIDGAWNCSDEKMWRTEIQIPVKLSSVKLDEVNN